MDHVFVGFGFGPIQSGLFVKEAFQSNSFRRIVVVEVDPLLVKAVRENGGAYSVNVAGSEGVEVETISGIEMFNPTVPQDFQRIQEALREATEIVTSLPSVNFYGTGDDSSVASMIAEAVDTNPKGQTIVYTAENNNHAAEVLQQAVQRKAKTDLAGRVQFLNTVIGKMSQVVTNPRKIRIDELVTMTPQIDRAFLVEQFNRILVTHCNVPDFEPGIKVFIEKEDLLPFEEAKLYGHNAIHAFLAYIGALKGYRFMSDLRNDQTLMHLARRAFLNESGGALIRKYESLDDPLFTPQGYEEYALDLLDRMTNPYLTDTIQRAGRDPMRKLGLNDRIFGTMTLALEYDITPHTLAMGAWAAIAYLIGQTEQKEIPQNLWTDDWTQLDRNQIVELLTWLWRSTSSTHLDRIVECLLEAREELLNIVEEKS